MPSFVESGFHGDRLAKDPDWQAVFELTDQYWGRWHIRRGDSRPPDGFEVFKAFGSAPVRDDDTYLPAHRPTAS